jgi:hypothetical protein
VWKQLNLNIGENEMPLGIRPRPKPNPNAIRVNSNFPNLPLDNNDKGNRNNKKQLGMGNVGNPETLIKLYCDLQTYGFCVVRRGWREGLDKTKPPIWIFCPLLKENFPRDRKLCEECKTCSHYKGVSRDLSTINQPKQTESEFKVNMIKAKKHIANQGFSKEDLEQAIKDKEKRDKEWEEEERKNAI